MKPIEAPLPGATDPSDPTFALDARGRAERALRAALALTGPGALFEPEVLAERLRDGEADVHETELLLAAVDAQVPQALLAAHGTHDEVSAVRFAKARLTDERGCDAADAAWAVDAWARSLRLESHPTQIVLAPDAALAPPTGIASAESDVAAVPADRRNASAELLAAASSLPQPSARRRAVSSWVGSLLSLALLAAVVYGADSVVDRARVDSVATAPASSNSASTSASNDAPNETPPATTASAPTEVAPTHVTAPIPPARVADPPSTPPVIADARSDEPLVADGDRHPLFVALEAPRSDVAKITSRFVSGDAALWRPATTIDVAPTDDARTRYPAGDVRVRSQRPAHAVFEYVAITRDGQRSRPFRQDVRVEAVEGDSSATRAARNLRVLTARGRCAQGSCGTVVSSEPIDDGFAFVARVATTLHLDQPVFHRPGRETRVRTDDGTIRVFRTHAAWSRGTRVRVVAGRIERLAPDVGAAKAPSSSQTLAAADPQR